MKSTQIQDSEVRQFNSDQNQVFNNDFCQNILSDVIKIDDKLRVLDEEHLINVIVCLDQIIDRYDDTALNVEDNQPLIDFENNLGFSSLRAKVENDIIKWENSIDQNDNAFPRDQYIAGLELLTIIDDRCEIYIGNELFNFCQDPQNTILNQAYASSDYSNPYYSLNRIDWCPFSDCCPYNWERRSIVNPNDNDRRMRVTVFASSVFFPFGGLLSYQGGGVQSQRRRNNGNWTGIRQKIKVVSTGGAVVSYFQGCSAFPPGGVDINNFHDDFKDRKFRDKKTYNLTLTSWAFEDNAICTTAEIKNKIVGSVCNEN